jgi:hypothetical protein
MESAAGSHRRRVGPLLMAMYKGSQRLEPSSIKIHIDDEEPRSTTRRHAYVCFRMTGPPIADDTEVGRSVLEAVRR